ncbi:hypothetical protein BJY01DRAFT_163826 [Aspergillus pseudoustus]|uniref:Zn(2)-C6 fungal-type domain-containing protein n=1 Tax=Aspergillus pseudoustus TaxID=1810923 RepID=A0ABR4K9E3_9EURO
MVNYGVSRACETCRRRRKKCDEAHPTCGRCAKAKKVCLGYRSYEELRFRHYALETPSPPTSESEQSPDRHAVASFVDQYVAHSSDSRVSRGFLNGLPSLLANAQPSSHVVLATEVVAWASLGNRLGRPDLLSRARSQYVSLLHSFQAVLQSFQLFVPTVEALVTAILLGLYEIISSHENLLSQEQEHVAHVRGVCALMLSPNSPFDLLSSTQLFQVANPLLIKHGLRLQSPLTPTPGVFCAPSSNNTVHDLDSILIQCHPLFERANTQLHDPLTPLHDLQRTLAHALEIEDAFSHWDLHKDPLWEPAITGHISHEDPHRIPSSPFFWPGPVHSFFDLYVAAVLNTYRKTYLMLLDVVIRLLPRTAPGLDAKRDSLTALDPNLSIDQVAPGSDAATNATATWGEKASGLVKDILASIPYHLAKDLSAVDMSSSTTSGLRTSPTPAPGVGRPVGGLLLLHPLYVLSSCTIVPPSVQMYVRKCLAWIGEHMGIGQATVMSKVCT